LIRKGVDARVFYRQRPRDRVDIGGVPIVDVGPRINLNSLIPLFSDVSNESLDYGRIGQFVHCRSGRSMNQRSNVLALSRGCISRHPCRRLQRLLGFVARSFEQDCTVAAKERRRLVDEQDLLSRKPTAPQSRHHDRDQDPKQWHNHEDYE
jgi:hypothetical protein